MVADEYPFAGRCRDGRGLVKGVHLAPALATTGEARFELKRPWGSGTPEGTFTLRLGQGN